MRCHISHWSNFTRKLQKSRNRQLLVWSYLMHRWQRLLMCTAQRLALIWYIIFWPTICHRKVFARRVFIVIVVVARCAVANIIDLIAVLHHFIGVNKLGWRYNGIGIMYCLRYPPRWHTHITKVIIRPTCLIACSDYEPNESDDDNDSLDALNMELSDSVIWVSSLRD